MIKNAQWLKKNDPATYARRVAQSLAAKVKARLIEIDVTALEAGFDTGTPRADLWRSMGRLG